MALRDLTPDELSSIAHENDSSLTDVQAEPNTVYHEPSDRVLSVPQGLDAGETQFVIDKDIDGKKRFFGQQPMDDMPPLPPIDIPALPEPVTMKGIADGFRGLGRGGLAFLASAPAQLRGGSMIESSELATEFKGKVDAGVSVNELQRDAMVDPIKAIYTQVGLLFDKDESMKVGGQAIIDRNKSYLARNNLMRPEEGGVKGVMYDLGNGLGSALSSLGIAVLTKSPSSAAILFGSLQKSQIYQESREAGKTPGQASQISTGAGAIEGVLEKIGLDHFIPAMQGNSVVKRFINGAIIEGVQEGSQQTAEEGITSSTGVRDQDLETALKSIAYSSFLGFAIGGGTASVLGGRAKKQAQDAGMPEDQAAKFGQYIEENLPSSTSDMGEFLRREVAPIAADNKSADEFMTLMQKFNNDADVVNREELSEQERKVFDEYIDYFNKSTTDSAGVDAVEKAFFDKAIAAGMEQDQAVAASKLLGMRADAASRALEQTPMEWYNSHNLSVEVQRDKEEAVQAYQESLDDWRASMDSEPTGLPEVDITPEERASSLEGIDAQLKQQRGVSTKEDKPKKVLLAWIKRNGGINIDSENAGELRNMGLKVKNAPGLFTKGKGMPLDNIPASEFNERFDVAAQEDGNGYVDLNWLLEQIDLEVRGQAMQRKPEARVDDSFARALEDAGLDPRTATAEQVYEKLGPDADIVAAGKEQGETLSPKAIRQIRGLMRDNPELDVHDAVSDWAERASIQGDTLFQTVDGNQTVLPGAEKISDKQLAERKFQERLQPKKAQKGMDEGLFGDEHKQTTLFQSVFHGSPHRFDKFTLDHIGNGEGAQAYGWGLYFAGNRSVAEFYRKKLSTGNVDRAALQKALKTISSNVSESEIDLTSLSYLVRRYADRPETSLGKFFEVQLPSLSLLSTQERKAFLDSIPNAGQLYEVDIPESDLLLDWDKPLSQQPKAVRAALETLGMKVDDKALSDFDSALLDALNDKGDGKLPKQPRDPSGEDIYKALTADSARTRSALQEKYGSEAWGRADKLASLRLNEAGIKGLQYLDGVSRNKAEGHHNFVIFDDSAINVLNTLYQEQEDGMGGVRGSTTFSKGGTVIRLFKDANASTIFHELGHVFLRDMKRVAADTKRPMVRNDWKIVKEWLGVDGNKLTEAQEEKFARGFEAYLREGKAPKPGLQGVFDRFKIWLESIYKSAKDLNVEINDDIRKVFDRMLGGDFVKAEKKAQKEIEDRREADYELAAQDMPSSSLMEDTGRNFRDLSNLGADAFVPVSTRLGNIDRRLKHAVRRFVFRTGLYSNEDRKAIEGFVKKVSKKFSVPDYKILKLALYNRDTKKVDELLNKYDAAEEWKNVRLTLDDIYNGAEDVGLDMGYIEDYFPRKVKSDKALEFLAFLKGTPQWGEIQEAIQQADVFGNMTPEERAEVANNYLRGFTRKSIDLAEPGAAKSRTIDYVTPQMMQFYDDPIQTLMNYITGVRHAIESRKLFGKSEKETDKNIGAYVLQLIEEGVVSPRQEAELKNILKAVVDPIGTRGLVGWSKNASYIYLMGSPISAITQIQDLAFSLAFNGYYRTGKALLKSLPAHIPLAGRKIGDSFGLIRKEDIGIDNILEEYSSQSRASKAVRATFKAVGLTGMDDIGKEVYINAALDRVQKANKKGGAAWDALVKDIFGVEGDQFKQDLKDGILSENVKYMLFSELSDIQPISLAEMPRGYLRGGNGRIFYMLKTYTVKQIDIYRRTIFSEIASGDPKRMIVGVRNLIHLGAALMLMGMASDALKDLLLGRKIDVDQLVTDNILKVMGFTKYQIYKARKDGIAYTFFTTLFVPPNLAPLDDLQRDVRDIGISEKKPLKDAEMLGRIPLVGKFYYWWWGGGEAKEAKKAD